MRDLRIVFMGTPDFAVRGLEKIVEAGYKVVGVITAPDRPAGRGRKLQESAVKKYASQQGLNILQPTNLKSEEFLNELKELKANIQVVVAFRMLPASVWSLPEYGTFNLHASLLPQYRGAAPINWAIINGETKTGVSTFFIDDKIDTGEMILQKKVSITSNETVGELHDELMETGSNLILDTLKIIQQGEVETTPQPMDSNLKAAPKLDKENTKINWQEPLVNIYNLIRGLNPYPAAWSTLYNNDQELKVKLFDCGIEKTSHDLELGKLKIEDKNIKVACKDGFLIIEKIQLPGKRKMKVKDLLNGFSFSPDAKFL